jgi:ABC-type glycerol-3-phosphate transport system substrate-binding protein/biotin operon repressor
MLPLYLEVKNELLRRIEAGEYSPGQRLPVERELTKSFGVSRITIVRAMKELMKDGLIVRRRGRGTHISSDISAKLLPPLIGAGNRTIEVVFGVRNLREEAQLLFQIICEDFHRAHPGISVTMQNIPSPRNPDDDPYLLLLASGNLPTVGEFYLHADYASLDGLVPLDGFKGFAETTGAIDHLCLHGTLNSSGESHVHAIPYRMDARAVLADVCLLREAGIDPASGLPSFETLLEWATALGEMTRHAKKETYGFACEIPKGWHGTISHYPYLWGDYNPTGEDDALNFLSIWESNAARGLGFLRSMVQVGNPCLTGEFLPLMTLGRIGFILSTVPYAHRLISQLNPSREIQAFPIPPETPGGGCHSVAGDSSLGIFAASTRSREEREAAWEWIRWLLRPDCQAMISTTLGCSPVVPQARSWISTQPGLKPFATSLKQAQRQPDFPGVRRAMRVIGRALSETIFEQAEPEATLYSIRRRLREEMSSIYEYKDKS